MPLLCQPLNFSVIGWDPKAAFLKAQSLQNQQLLLQNYESLG